MRELSLQEVNVVIGAGGATGGPMNHGGDQSCSDAVAGSFIGGLIAGGATGGWLGALGGGLGTAIVTYSTLDVCH